MTSILFRLDNTAVAATLISNIGPFFGGVNDGPFSITVAAIKTSNFCWCSPRTVSGVFSNNLNHKLKGRLVRPPNRGDANSSQGIL